METEPGGSCSACGAWWKLPALLVLVLAGVLLSRDRLVRELPKKQVDNPTSQLASGNAREHVSLAIDFGNGKKKTFDFIEWHEGITVADAMSVLPGTTVRQKGSGETAFLVSIDDVANDNDVGRYWMYRVNGKHADRSFAIYKLQPADKILWTFGDRQ